MYRLFDLPCLEIFKDFYPLFSLVLKDKAQRRTDEEFKHKV
jgi:hypothetical protein